MSLQTAYIASIGFSLLALFGLGVYVGRIASMNWALSLVAGATSGAIGVVVVRDIVKSCGWGWVVRRRPLILGFSFRLGFRL